VTTKTTYDICVLPGDGIGVDVVDATLPLLDKLTHDADFSLHFATHPAGAQHYAATGDALPAKTLEAARAADAIFFGAMGWPAIRYPDGTEIAPQLDLRVELELFAGVRPARALPGLPMPLADPRARQIDLVVVRESTEGLFASRGLGTIENDSVARDTMVITRKVEFSASHVCRDPRLSDEENQRIYGMAANPHGHGHNYVVEVSLEGSPDPVMSTSLALRSIGRMAFS